MEEHAQRSQLSSMLSSQLQRPVLMLVVGTAAVSLVSLGTFIYLQSTLLLRFAERSGNANRVTEVLVEYGLLSGGLFLTGLAIMVVWALLLGHRFSGPIPRLKRELAKMHRENEIRLLNVRKDDYLRPLIQRINQLLWGISQSSSWESPSLQSPPHEPDEINPPEDDES